MEPTPHDPDENWREHALAAVAEYEAEHGAFSPEELAATDALLDGLGFPPPPENQAAEARERERAELRAWAEKIRNDPVDRAEIAAIQAEMEDGREW